VVAIKFNPEDYRETSTLELMKQARRWLLWKSVPNPDPNKKPLKVPHYASGEKRGETDTLEDVAQLATYAEAKAALAAKKMTGLGFALGLDQATGEHWQGFDRDGSREGMYTAAFGYCEVSPSGNGFHVIGAGTPFRSRKHDGNEVYSGGRFFTFTGDVVFDGSLVDLTQTWVGKYTKSISGNDGEQYTNGHDLSEDGPREPVALTAKETKDLASALQALDSDTYDNWYRVFLALRGVIGGKEIAREWSRRSDKHSEAEFEKKFDTVGDPRGHWRSIFKWAKAEAGWDPATQSKSLKGPMVPWDYNISSLQPIEYLLDGFVPIGAWTISGSAGVGKTSIIVPWACMIAGVTQKNILTPPIRRMVYLFSEDIGQVESIIFGMKMIGFIDPNTTSDEEIKKWLKIIPSAKRSVGEICSELEKLLREAEPVMYMGHVVEPLVIFDTAVSNMEIKDQNDNAVIGSYISNIREVVGKTSIWFITHVSKASKNGDPESMSARGADSWVADVQGEMIIFKDPGNSELRRAMLGKCRGAPKFTEVVCHSEVREVKVATWWGEEQTILCRAAVVFTPSDKNDRTAAAAKAKAEELAGEEIARVTHVKTAFKEMLAKGSHVMRVGRGAHHIEVPAGSIECPVRDLLVKLALSKKYEEWIVQCLTESFPHQKYHGSNDTVAIVFAGSEAKE